MNKKELIERASQLMCLSKIQAQLTIEEVFEIVAKCMVENGPVTITKFGKFELIDVPARKARNPRTGEEIMVKAKRKVRFKPATALRERII